MAVVGVYARNADTGKYKKINAKNGVCLASGCCRSNEDMVRYFAPNIIWNGNGNPWPNMDVEGNRTNTGDGYKLGYWAGASSSSTSARRCTLWAARATPIRRTIPWASPGRFCASTTTASGS